MFLHCFSQRHVSALPRAIFRLITLYFVVVIDDIVDNNNIALMIVWFALQRKEWSTWRWPLEGPKHVVERSNERTSQ